MISALVVAGGSGERLGREGGKQLIRLLGVPMLAWTLRAFESCSDIDEVVLVAHPDRVDDYRGEAVEGSGVTKVKAVVAGGDTRQRSVAAGLAALSSESDMIAVHDGARPLITATVITAALEALRSDTSLDGIVVGHPSFDTAKVVDPDLRVTGTPERTSLWMAQTPQVFRAQVLRRAHEEAARSGQEATDDAALVSAVGGVVAMLEGPRENLKVTTTADVALAECLLEARGVGRGG